MEYTRYDENGGITGSVSYFNEKIEGSGRNLTITQEMSGSTIKTKKSDKKKVKKDRPSRSIIEVVDGTMTMSVDMKAKYKSLKISMKGPYCMLPYSMSVGDELEPFALTARASIIIISEAGIMYFDNRKVTGRETLDTPAGTFDCFRIEEEAKMVMGPIELSILGHHASEAVENDYTTTLKRVLWGAKDVGIVQMREYDKDGKQESHTLLTAIR